MKIDCPSIELNQRDCLCTNTDCERRGRRCECVRNHRSHGNLPACLRS